MRTLATFFIISGLLAAQPISFGVKGGGVLTDTAERLDRSDRYVVGGLVEVKLPARFAIEGDALYSRFGSALSASALAARTGGNTWEFPVLGKYYFSRRSAPVSPFVSAGVGIRKTWFDSTPSLSRILAFNSNDPAIGAVVGGGVGLRLWKLKFAPEVRYTRWGGNNFPATNPNELQVLLGIGF